jgi:hypothetical protein
VVRRQGRDADDADHEEGPEAEDLGEAAEMTRAELIERHLQDY